MILVILTSSFLSGAVTIAIFEMKALPSFYYKLKIKPFNCEVCTTFWIALLTSFMQIDLYEWYHYLFPPLIAISCVATYPFYWIAFWRLKTPKK